MEEIIELLKERVLSFFEIRKIEIEDVEFSKPPVGFGDLSTNVIMTNWKKIKVENKIEEKSPIQLAEGLAEFLTEDKQAVQIVKKVKVENPGFVNFYLETSQIRSKALELCSETNVNIGSNKKIMVEYGHLNTHKQLHIGHLRTLVTGEALARLYEFVGEKVFRANYQGDIGPHVAKALWGVWRLLEDRGQTLEQIGKLNLIYRGNFLGEAYVRGNQDYETNKDQIDDINKKLYSKDSSVLPIYEVTKKWSLEYYDYFYNLLGVEYDRLFFESEVAQRGLNIVKENMGKIFEEDQGAVVFKAEKYGFHTRVFITGQGTPTYEAKDMGLAMTQFEAFPFDENLHVVANEQDGYFKVVFQALRLIRSEIGAREFHVSYGMVNLTGMKMSSRTGVLLTLFDLHSQVVEKVTKDFEGKISPGNIDKLALAAIKYEILRHGLESNIAFDIEKSVSLTGNTGPYLQYTHARCASVLEKAGKLEMENVEVNSDWISQEDQLVKSLVGWQNALTQSCKTRSLHILCEFLYECASSFNTLYNDLPILDAEKELKKRRLALTLATKNVLREGLKILGIEAPDRL